MTDKPETGLMLAIDATGFGKVEIGGKSITEGVTGIDIKTRAGEPTQVTLHIGFLAITADVHAHLEAIGVVVQPEPEPRP